MMSEKESKFNVLDHEMVPKHRILSEEEKNQFLQKYGIKPQDLPRISSKDPVVVAIGAKIHDIIEIKRKSITAGEAIYYRIVVPNK